MSDNEENIQPQVSEKDNSSVANRNSMKSTTEKLKNFTSKFSKKKAGSRTTVKILSKILVSGGWVVLVIIVLIGIIMFFLTMPGLVMEKLKGLAKALGSAWADFWGGDSSADFPEARIYEVLDYLDEMGYDLKGYGFVTEFLVDPDTEYNQGGAEGEAVSETERKATKDGVIRDSDDTVITGVSDFIKTYLISDNYIYTIKNSNTVTDHWWEALGDHISSLFTDDLSNKKGMLVFFHDDGGIGTTEGHTGNGEDDNAYDAFERGYIKFDANSKKLLIKKGWTNNAMAYSLDGWTGRYGMPIDFLLTVHLATQMPDLAYDLVGTFQTEVNILLHKSSGQVEAQYKTTSGDYLGYSKVNKALNGLEGKNVVSKFINNLDNLGVSAIEAQKVIEMGIIPYEHGEDCGCKWDTRKVYTDDQGIKHIALKKEASEADTGTTEYAGGTTETGGADEAADSTATSEGWYYYEYDFNSNDIIETPITDDTKIVDENVLTEVGPNCKAYIKEVLGYLDENTDFKYETYTPYIENVINHWYRDVYFVIDPSNANSFIDYDYQYEVVTGERWTMYETYTSNTADGDLCNPEREGEFVYYKLNEDGTTGERYEGNVISGEMEVKDEDGNVKKDENGDPVIERFASRGEDGTLVVKKAKTIDLSDSNKAEDLGWTTAADGNYSAYSNDEDKSPSYERIFDDDEADSEAKKHMYIQVEIGKVTQTGEGLRKETNPKVKKMFLSNNYFKYDGSQQRAEIIYQLREKAKADGYDGYGPIKDDALLEKEYNLTFDEAKFTSNAENGTYKLKDYVGNVSFQQDALNTFAMLENSHTVDADYIYKDFKELVVELGYFQKEELTESKPKLLQWIVPDIGSSGYPDRSIDKREEEYGTMVHSKSDIDANKLQTVYSLIAGLGSEIPEGADKSGSTNTSDTANGLNNAGSTNVDNSAKGLESMGTNISIQEVGKMDKAERKPSQVPLTEFLDTTRKMCEYINKEGYDYCVLVKCDGDGDQHCTHDAHGNDTCSAKGHSGDGCNLPTTFEESKASTSKHNFCCATLVSWALQNVGVMPDSEHLDGADALATYIMNNLNPEVIQVGSPLQEGDILCYDGHIDMVGKQVSGGFEKYNGGHYTAAGSVEYEGSSCIEKISGWPSDSRIKFALRIKWGKGDPGIYEGYVGNEAVVSPVTGILMEYGTYDEDKAQENRENIDIKYGGLLEGYTFKEEKTTDPDTGEEITEIKYPYDKVGYAVIKILDAETYKKLESTVDNRWKNNSLVKINEKSEDFESMNKHVSFKDVPIDELTADDRDWSKMDETVYGYKEFVELYEQFGIGGYYIYIDGFKCEEVGETEEDAEEGEETEKKDESGQQRSPKIVKYGDPLTIDSFKISETDVKNDSYEPKTESLYEADEISKLISQDYSNKLQAESSLKADASIGVTFNYKDIELDDEGNPKEETNEYILIKEGTVLGRTLTDEEVVDGEEYRKSEYGTYEEYLAAQKEYLDAATQKEEDKAKKPENTNNSKTEDENLDLTTPNIPLMGNYLRIIMQEPDGSIVENVEDYMKLDEVKPKSDNDWELFFWLPFESGGTDNAGDGPECQGTCSSGETAVGIIQWTVLTSKNMNNISDQFISGCLEEDASLCAPLAAYKSWSANDFWNDYCGDKQFQATLSSICATDRDGFLHVQMEVAKKQYLEPLIQKYSWLEERPSCVQGAVMHLKVWGADTDWLSGYESQSDEEIVLKVRNVIANTGSTAAPASKDETKGRPYNEPQIALEILNGGMSAEDVEQWVRTKDTKYLSFDWKE